MERYQTCGNVILRLSDGASIPKDAGNRDYREYLEWVDAGGVPTPDPEQTPERRKARLLATRQAQGVAALDAAGYQNYKQLQMSVFVLGEVIKALKAVVVTTGVTIDVTKLDTVLGAIPMLTDLDFDKVVAMAAEIGAVRASVLGIETAVAALPADADLTAVLAMEVAKPKDRKDIEKGK